MIGCSTTLAQERLKGYSNYNTHTSRSRARQQAIAKGAIPKEFSSVTVYQYNLNGQYIAEYESISEAVRVLGHGNASKISAALNHKNQTAYGYQWSKEKVEFMPIIPVPRGKLVRCVNTNQIFHSTCEAAKWCGLKDHSGIGKCCTGKQKIAGKHPQTGEPLKWEYVE